MSASDDYLVEKKEEFRSYLRRSGVIDSLAKSLGDLYEMPVRQICSSAERIVYENRTVCTTVVALLCEQSKSLHQPAS